MFIFLFIININIFCINNKLYIYYMGIILFISIYTIVFVICLFLYVIIYDHYYPETKKDRKQLV